MASTDMAWSKTRQETPRKRGRQVPVEMEMKVFKSWEFKIYIPSLIVFIALYIYSVLDARVFVFIIVGIYNVYFIIITCLVIWQILLDIIGE